MAEIQLHRFDGGQDTVQIDDRLVGEPLNRDLLFRAVHRELANLRQGNASTKTRGEVAGSGRKPWKQKGTGRARAGSFQSPLWRGGGIIFGPKPRGPALKGKGEGREGVRPRTAFPFGEKPVARLPGPSRLRRGGFFLEAGTGTFRRRGESRGGAAPCGSPFRQGAGVPAPYLPVAPLKQKGERQMQSTQAPHGLSPCPRKPRWNEVSGLGSSPSFASLMAILGIVDSGGAVNPSK